MQFTVETEREVDGRWIAEVAETPGAMKYGKSEAIALAEALALRIIAEALESGKGEHYQFQDPSLRAKATVLSPLLFSFPDWFDNGEV